MTQYRLVMKITPSPATWESHPIERDSLAIGEELEVEGYPGRWRVASEHVPGDSDQPEPDAFDVEPVEGELAPPIRGSMSSATEAAAQNRRAVQGR